MPWRARTRVNLEGGGKEGTRTITDGLTNRNLNIRTESRGHLILCSGMEQHHPIMSKLRDLSGQTYKHTHIFEYGRNLLDQLDVTYQRAFMATSAQDEYYR